MVCHTRYGLVDAEPALVAALASIVLTVGKRKFDPVNYQAPAPDSVEYTYRHYPSAVRHAAHAYSVAESAARRIGYPEEAAAFIGGNKIFCRLAAACGSKFVGIWEIAD